MYILHTLEHHYSFLEILSVFASLQASAFLLSKEYPSSNFKSTLYLNLELRGGKNKTTALFPEQFSTNSKQNQYLLSKY